MYIELLDKNPLSLEPIIACEFGIFASNGVQVEYGKVPSFPAFDMTRVDANVGDTTRIFERLRDGEDLIITSDLTRTMKLMLCDDYKQKKTLKILAASEQSLGIYTEYFMAKNNLKFEYVIETNMQKRVEMIRRGEVDGACMIDPFLHEFIGKGYSFVYEGKNHTNNYTCWAFHRQFDIENPGVIKKFHKSLNEASLVWNNLSKDEKLQFAKKYLVFASELDDYYKNLTFNEDREYKQEDLRACFEWKKQKTPSVANVDISKVIYKW